MQRNIINRVVLSSIAATVVFGALVWAFPMANVIILMNGLFAGSMAGILVAYWRLLWNAILGVRPYDRVRQMTLGFATCWFAFCLSVGGSIYLRSSGAEPTATVLVAASRYVAIIAAVLQVTAPDFGLGIFHGRDRKVLTASLITGFLVALLVIWMQNAEVLAAS